MILTEREQKIKEFIKKAKLGKTQIAWLANDASGRRYARLTCPHKTYILMVVEVENDPLIRTPGLDPGNQDMILGIRIMEPRL